MHKTACRFDGEWADGGCAGCTAAGCKAPASWMRLTVVLGTWSVVVILGMSTVNHLFPERTTYAAVAAVTDNIEIGSIQPAELRRDPRIAEVERGDWLAGPVAIDAVVPPRQFTARRP